MTKLVGIGGRLAAGKDVVADYLVAKHGWVKLGMSDSLLEMALVLDPIVDEHDVRLSQVIKDLGYVLAKENPEVRRFLQALGTDVGRDMIDRNLWVRKSEDRIKSLLAQGKNVVITGIRFENEARMITRNDGTLVWVDRPTEKSNTATNHASEQLTSKGFDVTLVNDTTIEDLHRKAKEALL